MQTLATHPKNLPIVILSLCLWMQYVGVGKLYKKVISNNCFVQVKDVLIKFERLEALRKSNWDIKLLNTEISITNTPKKRTTPKVVCYHIIIISKLEQHFCVLSLFLSWLCSWLATNHIISIAQRSASQTFSVFDPRLLHGAWPNEIMRKERIHNLLIHMLFTIIAKLELYSQ